MHVILPRTLLLLFVLFLVPCPMAISAQTGQRAQLPSVELPPEIDRVLRDYEHAWRAGDEIALAALFAEDGFILRPGHPPVRGRDAIRQAYRDSGGPLHLRALAYAVSGEVGYVIGGYSGRPDGPDGGKFVLALRLGADGHWLIAADMDNGNG